MSNRRSIASFCRALGVAAIAASLYPAASAAAADFVMKFGTATMNETQHQYLKFYKEALEQASGGRIEVQIYPNSQLGPIPREIEGVQTGSIQAYLGPVDFFVGVDPRYGVFSAPMLFRDDANAIATIHDPALEKTMLGFVAAKNMVGMATLSNNAADYAGKRPLLTLADFNGKKLRINGTDLERAKMSRLGATGVAMPLSEVMPALDQGTIDGTISGLAVFVGFKMSDLVKTITITNDTFIIAIAVVSKPWLDTLPPDLQKLVIDTGFATQDKAQAWETAFSKDLEKQWTAMGGEVHVISTDDAAKMKLLLSTTADEVTKNQPAVNDMLMQVRAVAAKY
jgi:TRAP-type C4-dicarboxylate transport system substrate-binding protein